MTHFMRPFVKPIKYMPVFSGTTEDDQKIVLYRSLINETELHIKVGDDVLRAISPGSEVEEWFAVDDATTHISIVSPEWTGKATGTRRALIEEKGIK